ncbi:MAG: threonine ammonia-lyase [Thermoplasmata archaeon]|nr:MAG: threonine ammonia-lyase [Thermoplasmata archaeon]
MKSDAEVEKKFLKDPLPFIEEARGILNGVVRRTPTERSRTFSRILKGNVYLKMEVLQSTGSFKIRGAYNKIYHLPDSVRRRGVVASSTGNHAQGVAYAASLFDIPATIVMPRNTAIPKIEATRGYGAKVVLAGNNLTEAYEHAQKIVEKEGMTLIHPYDDPYIIAGQGTIGLEIMEDVPEGEHIVVPVGGGGLITGIAIAAKSVKEDVKVTGVQAKGACAFYISRKAGRLMETPSVHTIADGIAVKTPGRLTLELSSRYVDQVTTVDDEEISGAILMLMERAKLMVEGAGAASLAASLYGKIDVQGTTSIFLLSGGNIDPMVVARIIEKGLLKAGRILFIRCLLPDRPGELSDVLRMVSDLEGNVREISVSRLSPQAPLNQAVLELTVETKGCNHSQEVMHRLKNSGIKLL